MMMNKGLSETQACDILSLHRSTARYQKRVREDDRITRDKIRRIALARRGFGYRRIAAELRTSGDVINLKRVYRIYCQEHLNSYRRVRPEFIVGVGSSAGGVKACKELLNALPSDTGMAFVFVSHILPAAANELAEILSRHTDMTVMVASNGMPIRANQIYVSPSNADLEVERYSFKVVAPRSGKKQIDLFLTSLGEALGAGAIGIVLSGYGDDGAQGCKHIKAKGGVTFAQDNSAAAKGMPRCAQASGCVDFVLAPGKIAAELQRLIAV